MFSALKVASAPYCLLLAQQFASNSFNSFARHQITAPLHHPGRPGPAAALSSGTTMTGLRAWLNSALEVGRVNKGIDWVRFLFDGNRW